jgi:ribonucleoside-diphosphate reductase alpha chain
LLGFEYLNHQDQLHVKPKIADEMPIQPAYNLAQNEIKEPVSSTEVKPSPVAHGHKVHATVKPATPPTMGDAPACKSCGNITVRSGTCYTCLTCGTTSGCS